jgi:hypothetical protein
MADFIPILIVLIVCGAVVYILDHLEINPTFKMLARVVVIIAAVIYLLLWLAKFL